MASDSRPGGLIAAIFGVGGLGVAVKGLVGAASIGGAAEGARVAAGVISAARDATVVVAPAAHAGREAASVAISVPAHVSVPAIPVRAGDEAITQVTRPTRIDMSVPKIPSRGIGGRESIPPSHLQTEFPPVQGFGDDPPLIQVTSSHHNSADGSESESVSHQGHDVGDHAAHIVHHGIDTIHRVTHSSEHEKRDDQ